MDFFLKKTTKRLLVCKLKNFSIFYFGPVQFRQLVDNELTKVKAVSMQILKFKDEKRKQLFMTLC